MSDLDGIVRHLEEAATAAGSRLFPAIARKGFGAINVPYLPESSRARRRFWPRRGAWNSGAGIVVEQEFEKAAANTHVVLRRRSRRLHQRLLGCFLKPACPGARAIRSTESTSGILDTGSRQRRSDVRQSQGDAARLSKALPNS